MKTSQIKQQLLKHFPNSTVYFSPSEIPKRYLLPPEWKDFGLRTNDTPIYPHTWLAFKNRLPNLLNLFDSALLGTAFIAQPSPKLIYIFEDPDDFYFYVGEPPINALCDSITRLSSIIPPTLRDFYLTVHNRFTFHPAQSMGPARFESLFRINEISTEKTISARNLIAFFSNGGGDYIAFEKGSKSTQGYIWWHEQQSTPDPIPDIFEIWDVWTCIFLEDTVIQNRKKQQ